MLVGNRITLQSQPTSATCAAKVRVRLTLAMARWLWSRGEHRTTGTSAQQFRRHSHGVTAAHQRGSNLRCRSVTWPALRGRHGGDFSGGGRRRNGTLYSLRLRARPEAKAQAQLRKAKQMGGLSRKSESFAKSVLKGSTRRKKKETLSAKSGRGCCRRPMQWWPGNLGGVLDFFPACHLRPKEAGFRGDATRFTKKLNQWEVRKFRWLAATGLGSDPGIHLGPQGSVNVLRNVLRVFGRGCFEVTSLRSSPKVPYLAGSGAALPARGNPTPVSL